ncbi:CinA family protein [Candidimonas sp. SYP-B2681]|uniref:CinA family protein n=1 Tax=Candidimonas sp. SYP-B2681 TaxID=2497686 RepID=UPI000F879762|nr:CinA family protein [Candidimonas sp. SYP-B2681]RTZ41598.1 CinA family protein [Candidimonas sp. SYP-B2681]
MASIEKVADFMRSESLMLVTAESCTAGLIAATLADIPGAGELLDCAFVVYSPDAKKNCVAVKQETLDEFNLTSEEIAREMAEGALGKSRANVAVSNTGVTDNTDDAVPAGTQCFAWAFQPNGAGGPPVVFSETCRFSGDRTSIRQASAEYALERIPHYFSQLRKQ